MSVLERIRESDTEYDPVVPACEAAGIPRALFAAALNRVFLDGYYGPIRPEAWIEAHEGEEHLEEVALTRHALVLLERVSDEIEGYRETFFGLDEDDEEVEWTEETVSAEAIRREVFAVVYDIYGRLPW